MLSETVGRAIQHCPGEEHREEAEFVLAADRAFDVLNSGRPLDSKRHRCGFGVPEAFEEPHEALMAFNRLMRVCLLEFKGASTASVILRP